MTPPPIDLTRALAIQGWMSRAELAWLATRAQTCAVIVEFGCYKGRSTRALADHCPGVVYAVDPWVRDYPTDAGRPHRSIHADVFEAFQAALADHLQIGRVVAVRAPSGLSLPHLAAVVGAVDLVFIDGDHRYATVLDDIVTARALVRRGGVIAGHDYGHRDWPGVRQAVDEAFPSGVAHCDSIWSVRP